MKEIYIQKSKFLFVVDNINFINLSYIQAKAKRKNWNPAAWLLTSVVMKTWVFRSRDPHPSPNRLSMLTESRITPLIIRRVFFGEARLGKYPASSCLIWARLWVAQTLGSRMKPFIALSKSAMALFKTRRFWLSSIELINTRIPWWGNRLLSEPV